MITTPKRAHHHPDRGLEIEEAVESDFKALADCIEAAGWSQDETAYALLNLAVARIKMLEANERSKSSHHHHDHKT